MATKRIYATKKLPLKFNLEKNTIAINDFTIEDFSKELKNNGYSISGTNQSISISGNELFLTCMVTKMDEKEKKSDVARKAMGIMLKTQEKH